jgi:hypothetical protein
MLCLQLYHYNRQERVGAKLKLTIASTRRIVQATKDCTFLYLAALRSRRFVNDADIIAPRHQVTHLVYEYTAY